MRNVVLILAATFAFGADDGWQKVQELKTGTEIRVVKKGLTQPLFAKSADATDDKLLVIVKNAQIAIDRSEIDRIDARPSGRRPITKQSKESTNEPSKPMKGARPEDLPSAESSYSSTLSVGSKPDFETIYRRTAGK